MYRNCITLFVWLAVAAMPGCRKGEKTEPIPSGKDFSALTQVVEEALPQLGGNAGLLLISKDGKVLYKGYWGRFSDSTYLPVASGSKWPSVNGKTEG